MFKHMMLLGRDICKCYQCDLNTAARISAAPVDTCCYEQECNCIGFKSGLISKSCQHSKATRSKDATRGSWPYYQEQEATRSKGHRYERSKEGY